MSTDSMFDHHSADYAKRWPEIYAAMHASKCPITHTEAHGGFYVASSYGLVERIVKDDATFSSRHDIEDPGSPYFGITQPPPPIRTTPIELDPPEYTYFRKALNPYFSPGATKRWEPWLRDVMTALLDEVIETGRMDVVDAIASPLPALLTAELLGLPLDDWRTYSEAAHGVVAYPAGTPEFDAAQLQFLNVLGRAFETAVLRRQDPKDDLISLFVGMEEDGAPLSDQRVIEMTALMIAGGNDTTTSLLSGALHWFAQHPDRWAWVKEDLARLDGACEEFLRVFTPTQILGRTVTCPVELEGIQLKEGDRVLMSFAAANRDPSVFDSPDEVQLDRFPNRHQAFGLGLHRCLGSNFTRLEFRVVFEELIRRVPDINVDVMGSVPYESVATVNGWHLMPATFTPGHREGSDFTL